MSLQNRVDPWGALHAVPQRGTMLGNRGGRFHRDDRTLGKRRKWPNGSLRGVEGCSYTRAQNALVRVR